MKKYPIVGACGLDCGLCPRYYTEGTSRCNGCGSPTSYPSCSIFRCCVRTNGFETCAECMDFPCSRFKDAWEEYDSFLTHKRMRPNLNYIQENDVENHVHKLEKRMELFEEMLRGFNEGRSKSFYCVAATLLPVESLTGSIDSAKKKVGILGIGEEDIKSKARILKESIHNVAAKEGIDLRLRKRPKASSQPNLVNRKQIQQTRRLSADT